MRRSILGILVLAAMLALLAAAQNDDGLVQAVAKLQKDVASMGLRLDRLEHAGGVPPRAAPDATTPSAAGAAAVAHSMVVGGISTSDTQVDHSEEIDQLQDDVEDMQDTVDYHMDQAEREGGRTFHSTPYRGSNRGSIDRKMISQRNMANRYATEVVNKKQRIRKLQAASNKATQVINGHDGDTIITLRSTVDISSSLTNINIGDSVTWRGRRVSATETSETWQIESIRKIEAN
ncbi:MAG: hypothetical protein ACYTGG_05475 [Planctomycetota bacterium]